MASFVLALGEVVSAFNDMIQQAISLCHACACNESSVEVLNLCVECSLNSSFVRSH